MTKENEDNIKAGMYLISAGQSLIQCSATKQSLDLYVGTILPLDSPQQKSPLEKRMKNQMGRKI